MKSLEKSARRFFPAVYLLLLLAAAFMYAVLSCNRVVWGDEAYTFALIRHSFPEIWRITAADVHPPLYYFLLKLLTAPFDYRLYAARLASALPCLLLTAIAGWELRRRFGAVTALLFMVLYLAFPFSMNHAAEVRMYGLAQCFVMLNALWGWRCWHENRTADWCVFTLTGTAAAYTHYFAMISVAVTYGMLLLGAVVRKRELLKKWFCTAGATVLLYLPWLGGFLSQLAYKAANEYWIPPITPATFVGYAQELFGTAGPEWLYIPAGLTFAAALVCLAFCENGKERTAPLAALAVPVGTLLLGVLISALLRPIFIIRYLLPSVPLLLFAAAYALAHSPKAVCAALMAVSVALGGLNFLSVGKNALRTPNYSLDDTFVNQHRDVDCIVVYSGSTSLAAQSLAYYAPEKTVYSTYVLESGNPFLNWLHYADFHPEAADCILLVLESGAEIPAELASQYPQSEFLRDFDVYGARIDCWRLSR